MADLRAAFADVLGHLPGVGPRAADVARALRLDAKLAWQMVRIATASDPLAEVRNIPARSSIRRLEGALVGRRVPRRVIDRVWSAFERFEQFTELRAGDRDNLVSMLAGLSGVTDEQYEVRVRKALFRAQSHVWGVQASSVIRTGIFHPGLGPEHVEDAALVHGEVGLRCSRRVGPTEIVAVMRTAGEHDSGADAPVPVRHGLKLLEEFSTHPLPTVVEGESINDETGLMVPTARDKAITLYSSQKREGVAAGPQSSYEGRSLLTVPTETAVWELLIPEGWTNPSSAHVSVYGRREQPERVLEERTEDLLPQREVAQYLGVMTETPPLPGSPSHHLAVRHVLAQSGWLGTRFDIFRCFVAYPVLHSMIALRVNASK